MATKKVGSTGRYGPRYGTKAKKRIAVVERDQKKKYNCPYCERPALKRLSAGIWFCKKCGKKFAGAAYFPKSAIATGMARTAETLKEVRTKTGKGD